MCKVYRYKNLSFPVNDDSEVCFSVEFISDGNSGYTAIDIPGNLDPEIRNSGKVILGKGRDLRSEATLCFSSIDNKVPQENEIRVKYLINDVTLIEHHNLKTEAERVNIILKITFPMS